MEKINLQIIKDFCEGNFKWLQQMEKMGCEKYCFVCGISPEKMKELQIELKKLI